MKNIIIHCSATPNGRPDTAEDLHRYHKGRGFDGIGYHYVVCVDGVIENGRPEYWTGAHARGCNTDSIGVCLIGTDSFSDKQWDGLEWLIQDLLIKHENAKVIGHNEISSKTCPGFNVQDWLKTL